ncbi:MAG TPA: hypothetical protein V6D19_15150, partial [Stenomitos sp.]
DMKRAEPEPVQAKPIAEEAPEAAVKPKAKADRETEDYALTVQQMLAQRGINTGRFQIHINEAVVFKMKEGNIERSKLTPDQTEAIKLALSDPAALKGTVKISQGGNILLHVKDGQVLVDSLGLVKPAAKVEVTTPQSPGELLYNNASKGVSAEGMRRTSEVVANAFRSGATKEQVMEMVKGHDPAYKEAVESKGQRAADKAFEQLVEHSQGKVHLESQPKQERVQSQTRALQR